MTKPITSVAALMLYEEGAFELKDPIEPVDPVVRRHAGVPGRLRRSRPETRPAVEPVRVWHLLTHTAGLTYGFHYAHPVDALYRAAGFEWGTPPGLDLAGCCDAWAGLPLLFEPGTEWNYSVATDVLGRLVEVMSGQSLDEFFRTRIFEPAGHDRHGVLGRRGRGGRPPGRRLHAPTRTGPHAPGHADRRERRPASRPRCGPGGGGLVGTAGDYLASP